MSIAIISVTLHLLDIYIDIDYVEFNFLSILLIYIYIYISKNWSVTFNVAVLLLNHISVTSSNYFQYVLSHF